MSGCESGCKKRAKYTDAEGVPLCEDCYISLLRESLEKVGTEAVDLRARLAETERDKCASDARIVQLEEVLQQRDADGIGMGMAMVATESARDAALARAAVVERERDELLLERACVDEHVTAFRTGADRIDATANALEASSNAPESLIKAFRTPAAICRLAADTWGAKPKLPYGLANECAILRANAETLTKSRDAALARVAEVEWERDIWHTRATAHEQAKDAAELALSTALAVIATAERMIRSGVLFYADRDNPTLPIMFDEDEHFNSFADLPAAVTAWGEANPEADHG